MDKNALKKCLSIFFFIGINNGQTCAARNAQNAANMAEARANEIPEQTAARNDENAE